MHGRVNVVRMPATCRATWKKIMHKRAKISGHINQHIAEIFSRFAANKQAQSMREGGSVFFEGVGAFDIAHISCTPHTRQLHT